MRHAAERGRPWFILSLLAGLALVAAWPAGAAESCAKPVYLTFDTGSQSQAQLIHDILQKHGVKASFFLANEKTVNGDYSLDPAWAPYWRTLVAEGHAFGAHTFDHVSYRGADGDAHVRMRPQFGANAGKTLSWSGAQVCAELNRVKVRFKTLTGADLDPIWRAPGGKTSATLNAMAQSCGYRHVGWAEAGFLGDELPSEKWPNALLLQRALTHIRPGDIVMAHLGIWSRRETFAPTLDPLIAGLKQQGFCFRTLREHPQPGGRS